MEPVPAKRPLHPDGATPVEDADMPLSELDSSYNPDRVVSIEDTPELTQPAIVQNGDPQ